MDSFEWNKIIGAILGTLLFVFIVNEAANITFHGEEESQELVYPADLPEDTTQAEAEKEPEVVDFGTLLRDASAERGENVAKRCLQCHTFEKGGPNKTGPNLWGIIGSEIAAHEGFNYSNALTNMEGQWTYERIYKFVGAPSRYIPGTNMNFAGLRRQSARMDLLAYMRTMADNPPPIPEPLPEETEEAPEASESDDGKSEGGAAKEDDTGAVAEDADDDEKSPNGDQESADKDEIRDEGTADVEEAVDAEASSNSDHGSGDDSDDDKDSTSEEDGDAGEGVTGEEKPGGGDL